MFEKFIGKDFEIDMRNKIFISHASPEDNDFTKWLSLKMISLGYEVWCDLLCLEKGVDFWNSIEHEIRNNTIKYLIVLSSISNNRDGVLKELAVADKVKKQLNDDAFVVPILIDSNLSYDDMTIELVRLNAIDFRQSWAIGLRDVLHFFEKEEIPKKSPNPSLANSLYKQIYAFNKAIIKKEEVYDSNWFPIQSFPDELRFHKYGLRLLNKIDVNGLNYPAVRFKEYLCTFAWAYDFIDQLPDTETYSSSDSISIPTDELLKGKYNSEFIQGYECKKFIVQIINKAFESYLMQKRLRNYPMSKKMAYWIEKGQLEKDKFNKIKLVGKQKDKTWHFGIAGEGKLNPLHVLMISSHIIFTNDGVELIQLKNTQHSARRRQGKNWWNDTWRKKLLSFVKYISDNSNFLDLKVGSEEKIKVSTTPIKFISNKSYIEPNKNIFKQELDLASTFEYTDE